MGSSTHAGGGLVGNLWTRRGEGRLEEMMGRRGEGKGSCRRESKRSLFRKRWWEVDMGAEVTPPSMGIVFGAEVLMHVPFWLSKMSKSDGALRD